MILRFKAHLTLLLYIGSIESAQQKRRRTSVSTDESFTPFNATGPTVAQPGAIKKIRKRMLELSDSDASDDTAMSRGGSIGVKPKNSKAKIGEAAYVCSALAQAQLFISDSSGKRTSRDQSRAENEIKRQRCV